MNDIFIIVCCVSPCVTYHDMCDQSTSRSYHLKSGVFLNVLHTKLKMFWVDTVLISQMLPKKARLLLIKLLRFYIEDFMSDMFRGTEF